MSRPHTPTSSAGAATWAQPTICALTIQHLGLSTKLQLLRVNWQLFDLIAREIYASIPWVVYNHLTSLETPEVRINNPHG